MKLTTVSLIPVFISALDVGEKKVPPRHPRQRLKTLLRFGKEWLADNFVTAANNEKTKRFGNRLRDRYTKRFDNWTARMQVASMKECFFFDPENLPHGGRNRRDDEQDYDYEDDTGDLLRYDKDDPIRGLKQIMTGYRKWSTRYISECPGERNEKNHSTRAKTLHDKISNKLRRFLQNNQ
jgi:hypothetical protein